MLFALVVLIGAAAAGKVVAVLPIEARAGSLQPAEASALEEEIRAVAREALPGFTVLDAKATAGAPQDPRAALERSEASAVVLGRAGRIEGATVVALGVYRPGSPAPAGVARIAGIGIDQLKEDVRAKVPRLLTTALGLAPPQNKPAQRPGTLRIPPQPPPTSAPQTAPAKVPTPRAAPPPKVPQAAAPEVSQDPLVALIRQVASEVESLRGLRRKSNLKVQILDDKFFTAAVREKAQKELTPALVAAERVRWLAFNLAPASADPAQILLSVLDEQVTGFNDPFSKQLLVRKELPASATSAGPEGLRLVLAHEIEHALQDENFGFPGLSRLPDDDTRLARLALYEGDAMAVMTAYGAQRAKKSIKASIASAAAALKSVDTESLLRISGLSPELLKAPAVLREELILPYAAGFALVAEVFRRGGFALVDRMFANPPTSSHQVLHPEAYFAGEAPAVIAAPSAPPGTRRIASGRMGELGTRLALEACVDKSVVTDFARRWDGDAYTIVEGPPRALSLLWISSWSGAGAEGIANLLRMQVPCWEEAAASRASSGWTIAAASKLKSAGNRIAVARGSIDLDAALAAALAARAAPARAVPPLGDVPAPPVPGPARYEDGHFASPRLALEGTLPEGYQADASNPAAEISIKRTGPVGGSASLSFVPEALYGQSLEAFFETAAAQIGAAQGGGHLSYGGKAQRILVGARAEERNWRVEGGGLQLRIEVAPFCEGKAALALVRLESSEAARAALDGFAASIKSTIGAAPVCTELE
jgi:hypothetical protein